MTRIVEWLLDLEHVRLGRDTPLLPEWNTHYQAWMLVGFGIVALMWVVMIYRGERASLFRRIVPAGIRICLIAVVVAIICRPSLVLQRNRVEPSYVAVLLDRSESMATRDWYADPTFAARLADGAGLSEARETADRSRLDLLQALLLADETAPLKQLLENNALLLSAFAGHAAIRAVATGSPSLEPLEEAVRAITADGPRTDLAQAIRDTIEGAAGRRLAAIVLGSDGQSTETSSLRDALDLARGRRIPIFPIRIGEPIRPKDIEVGPIRAESSVFVRDVVAVEVPLSAQGLDRPTTAKVSLSDAASRKVIDVREVSLGPDRRRTTVELHARPTKPGRAGYRVDVAPIQGERVIDNNSETVEITVVDSKLRVLFVGGYPRYEYRYLKNALIREESMELSVLLIDADEQFVQEGTDPIRRFPETPEALHQYDVVLFGDVDPRGGWLTLAQMNMLLDFVGNEGGGFGLIAGERAAPHRYLGTPLAPLIPVRIDPEFLGRYTEPLTVGYSLQLTEEGRRSRIFRAAPESGGNEEDGLEGTNPFESLPELYWTARTLGPKPGAVVLAEHPTMRVPLDQSGDSGLMPIVVTGRYGAGKLFFQGTDDTWRWRRQRGELLHDTYWVQVTRELMRGDRLVQSRRYLVRTEGRVFEYGTPIHVQIDVSDERILVRHPEVIPMSVYEPDEGFDSPGTGAAEQTEPRALARAAPRIPQPAPTSEPPRRLEPAALVARFAARRLSATSKRYEGSFLPPHPGRFLMSVEGMERVAGSDPAPVAVRVERPSLESRHPEANYIMLERIAEATGGRVVEPDRLREQFAEIRNRSVQIPDDVTEPLWDSKLALLLFTLLITTEWVLRKVFGML